ncbi:MAG TPA: tetratricopeptide repeat protein [Gemmatimonadales bacterium]|nr:tetratricopeptide repeat protein [Gemmatimonadales bacterium]
MTEETTGPLPKPLKRLLPTRERQLAALAALLVLIALGVLFAVVGGRRKEAYAARALEQARATAEAGNLPLASSQFQRLIQGYGDTDAGQEAVLALNQIRMINGQSELAVVGLREFLADDPDPEFAAPANGLLAAALENAGKPAEAAQAYVQASETANLPYLKAEYLVEAARAYEAAGQRDQAVGILRRVVKEFEKTPVLTEAQVRLAELTGGRM